MSGASALIGHTGFVGGTLLREGAFDRCFNSTSVDAMRGQSFGLVVCAGVSAVKWKANKEPEADRAGIARLTTALAGAEIAELVLISTVDVYAAPGAGPDEGTAIDPATQHAYGRHRFELETWCRAQFPLVRVVRLPALFGAGLRKNVLYDLMHGHMLDSINPAGVFQWYPTARLWGDLAVVRRAGLGLVNLVPAPLPMRTVLDRVFPGVATGAAVQPAPAYDVRTRHAGLFGQAGDYIMDAADSLEGIAAFVAA